MDFFARQDLARRKTKWLIFYFALAVASMVLMIYGVAVLARFYLAAKTHHYYEATPAVAFWDPEFFCEIALATIAVIFIGSLWKTMDLAGGGGVLAESLGGRLVASNTTDLDERRLLNVVEEMAIASGVPMPQVYVLEYEDGINAFAAGHKISDAAIAVTGNCMKKLTREELQGVIGHEFSHILNGDMKLNLRLIGILFGIFCIATIGRVLVQTGRVNSRGRGQNPLPLLGLLLLAIGSLGVFFGRLIQAAISRQREFLADASAVQFTRNPGGLSGALQKVGGYTSSVLSPHAPDAAHLFFANVNGSSFFEMMATHPPLEERIRALDPTWNGKFVRLPDPKRDEIYRRETTLSPPPGLNNPLAGMVFAGGVAAEIQARSVLPNLGNLTPLHLKYAEQMRNSFSENLRSTAREPLAATALIYALLLDVDENLRPRQLAEISRRTNAAIAEQTAALLPEVSAAARRARLPLVNLALSPLRQLTPEQFQQFSGTLDWLVNSDGRVELFEFVLQKIIRRHLAPKFGDAPPVSVQYYTLKPLLPDCAVILSALANVGSTDAGAIQNAFTAGAPFLRAPENPALALLARENCGIDQVNAALDRLALAAPVIKKNLIAACAHVVGADGVILETEAELLRAVSDTLDCPMPPLGVSE